jgi:flagellar hook-associated protein 3 FlgL
MSYSLDALYRNASWSIGQQSAKLAILQEKAGTGQEVNRVSDNPDAANRILGLTSDKRTKEQYLESISGLASVLDLSSSVLQSMTAELTQAQESMASIVSGTTSVQTRQTLALYLNNSLEQLVSLANTQRLGQSLFAGANSVSVPYTVEYNSDGEISQVIYQGSMQENPVEVTKGVSLSGVLAGPTLFSADERETPVFYGQTGAAAGTGTSSARGGVYLQIQGSDGAWQLSIDGGQNWVSADGTEENLAVVNSQTGEVLYVNTTDIEHTGTEPILVPGTYDLFNVLICARDLLKNVHDLPDDQLQRMLSDTLMAMKDAEEKLTRSFSIVGGRQQTLENLSDSIKETKVSTEDDISQIQDADIAQISIDLARYDVLYQMSLAITSKMFSLSFLDFMK